MNKKTLYLLIVILVICILIFSGIKIITHIVKTKKVKELKIKPDKITKFEINNISKKEQLCFIKELEKWKVYSLNQQEEKYDCDENAVKQLLEKFSQIKLTDIVSEDKERQQDFEVDQTSTGIILKIYYKDKPDIPEKSFIIGKSGFDYNHYYFRFFDKQEIYLSKGLEKYSVDKDLTYWRDKTILKLDRENIEKIKYTGTKQTFELIKKDNDWYIVKKSSQTKPDTSKLDSFLNTLCNLVADGFGEEKYWFTKPDFTILIETKNKDLIKLDFSKSDKGWIFVIKNQNKQPFWYVYDYKLNTFRFPEF